MKVVGRVWIRRTGIFTVFYYIRIREGEWLRTIQHSKLNPTDYIKSSTSPEILNNGQLVLVHQIGKKSGM